MCELAVYLFENGKETIFMEDVASIKPDGEQLVLVDILGRQKTVQARFKELKLLEHKVYLVK